MDLPGVEVRIVGTEIFVDHNYPRHAHHGRILEEGLKDTQALVRMLRGRGWALSADKGRSRRYPTLPAVYLGRKNELHCEVGDFGLAKMSIWSEDWPSTHRTGHRYERNIREKMPYATGLRADVELRAIKKWLDKRHQGRPTKWDGVRRRMTAMEQVQARDRERNWFQERQSSADGRVLYAGATVWIRDYDYRVRRGKAYPNINQMWWVVLGEYDLRNFSGSSLLLSPPANLRREVPADTAKRRLKTLLNSALDAEKYTRASELCKALQRNLAKHPA